jgi:hypothetical protein
VTPLFASMAHTISATPWQSSFSALGSERRLVELTGIEPVTSCLPDKRSPR